MPGMIIIGAGPGIGLSVARHFAREGVPVGMIARSSVTVDAALSALDGSGVETRGATADAADEEALRPRRAHRPSRYPRRAGLQRRGHPGDSIGDLSVAQHLDAWAVNVVGAITAAAHLLPRMAEAGKGTYVITGGMPTPVPEVTSLSLGKAGVRALTELLDTQFGSSGVHVATVGGVIAPGTAFDPDDIAEHYWRLHRQPREEWEREVVHDGQPSSARRGIRGDEGAGD